MRFNNLTKIMLMALSALAFHNKSLAQSKRSFQLGKPFSTEVNLDDCKVIYQQARDIEMGLASFEIYGLTQIHQFEINLMDTGREEIQIKKAKLRFKWGQKSLVNTSGSTFTKKVEELIKTDFKRSNIEGTGLVNLKVNNSLLLCDIMAGNLNLEFEIEGFVSSVEKGPVKMSESEILRLSLNLQSYKKDIVTSQQGFSTQENANRELVAGAILGYQMAQVGVSHFNEFTSEDLLKLSSQLFMSDLTYRPKEITKEEARQLEDSLRISIIKKKSIEELFSISNMEVQ